MNRVWEYLPETADDRQRLAARKAIEQITFDGDHVIEVFQSDDGKQIDAFIGAGIESVDIFDPLPGLIPQLVRISAQLDQEIARLTALQKGGAE